VFRAPLKQVLFGALSGFIFVKNEPAKRSDMSNFFSYTSILVRSDLPELKVEDFSLMLG